MNGSSAGGSMSPYSERRDINEVYANHSWTAILRRAGLVDDPAPEGEGDLLKRVSSLLHVDDPDRVKAYTLLLSDDCPVYSELDLRMQTYATMLFFSLWPKGGGFTSIGSGLQSLRVHRQVRNELRQVLAYGVETAMHVPKPLGLDLGPLTGTPLAVHAHYNAFELLAALRWASLKRVPGNFREGVAWCPDTQTDALFVTINKDAKDFSENVRYRDFALSEQFFHWESQNRTSAA
ncbi:DUF3427 domain-containing protein [Kitasatospora sp. GP82]|uniref:DUF3427 domain-containing protein n=1 Tax=Kitasatospora sp. GP82 TaxID=3035089 RepID=UPI0024767BCF|nr:DUF3427 domain-containing protein [Kitasatospora sp. GP82]